MPRKKYTKKLTDEDRSSSSDTDDEQHTLPDRKIKRSFRYLHSNYNENDVCKTTRNHYQLYTSSSNMSSLSVMKASNSCENELTKQSNKGAADSSLNQQSDELQASIDDQLESSDHSLNYMPDNNHNDEAFNVRSQNVAVTNSELQLLSSDNISSNCDDTVNEYSSNHSSTSDDENTSNKSNSSNAESDIGENSEVESNTDNSNNAGDEENDNFSDVEFNIPAEVKELFYSKIMFSESKITVRDAIVLVAGFSLKFKLSDEARHELMQLLKLCAGPSFDKVDISKYKISKIFSSYDNEVTYSYYCPTCMDKIIYSVKANKKRKKSIECEKCHEKYAITLAAKNYFLSVDLTYQLQLLLSNQLVFNDVMQNVQFFRENTNSQNMKGIFNGKLYKDIMEANKNDNSIMLTLNANTDGFPTSKSGKEAGWPMSLTLNELSPKLMSKFILLAGMLMVQIEPDCTLMNLYLSQFVDQIIKLYNKGIIIEMNGKEYNFRFCILTLLPDTVCRRIMQNRVQFNGYFGCSWCYHRGKWFLTLVGTRYVISLNTINRTHESHLEDVRKCLTNNAIRNGVKGESVLSKLPHIDMTWSFGYEYMHTLGLGTGHQVNEEWKNPHHPFHIKPKDWKVVEKRFLSIKPTQDVQRLPRKGIIVGSAKKKASEEIFWILIASLPCLKGILNNEALEHYSVFVKSTFTLLKSEISEDELNECERDLLQFAVEYEKFYGEEKMTFNVHSTSFHAVDSIKMTGPLCYNSAFVFESYIRTLKSFITGSNGKDYQMLRKHLQAFTFTTKNTKSQLSTSEVVENYCYKLFEPKKLTTFYKKNSDVTFCGRSNVVNNELGRCLRYKKCIFNDTVYHSIYYTRACKSNDTIVELKSGEYCRIVDILNFQENCYLKLSLIKVCSQNPFNGINHIKKIEFEEDSNQNVLKSVNDVLQKVIYIKISDSEKYLATFPNKIEVR